jgi:mRNA export factor
MTAGSEGSIIFWDYNVKNKIRTFNCAQIPITAAKMSHDGSMLAYAMGYDFSKGPDGYSANLQNKLCIHIIPDNELKCNSK